jgi:hypothetical protein
MKVADCNNPRVADSFTVTDDTAVSQTLDYGGSPLVTIAPAGGVAFAGMGSAPRSCSHWTLIPARSSPPPFSNRQGTAGAVQPKTHGIASNRSVIAVSSGWMEPA